MTLRTTVLPAACLLALFTGAAAAQDGAKASGFDASRLVKAQIQPAAAVEADDEPTCNRARRRLWIEGEGWVVRKITTCR